MHHGPKKFRSSAKKDFFNTIRGRTTFTAAAGRRPLISKNAEVGSPERRVRSTLNSRRHRIAPARPVRVGNGPPTMTSYCVGKVEQWPL